MNIVKSSDSEPCGLAVDLMLEMCLEPSRLSHLENLLTESLIRGLNIYTTQYGFSLLSLKQFSEGHSFIQRSRREPFGRSWDSSERHEKLLGGSNPSNPIGSIQVFAKILKFNYLVLIDMLTTPNRLDNSDNEAWKLLYSAC